MACRVWTTGRGIGLAALSFGLKTFLCQSFHRRQGFASQVARRISPILPASSQHSGSRAARNAARDLLRSGVRQQHLFSLGSSVSTRAHGWQSASVDFMFRVPWTSRSTSASASEEALQSQDDVLHRQACHTLHVDSSEPPFRRFKMISSRAALQATHTHTPFSLVVYLLRFPSLRPFVSLVSLSPSLAPLLDSGSTWTSKFGAQGAHPCAHGRLPALSRSQEGRGGALEGSEDETPPFFCLSG